MFKKIVPSLFKALETIRSMFSGLGFRKIKFIDKTYNFFFKKLRPDFVMLHGQRFYMDSLDVLNISKPQNREGSLLPILTKEIKPGYRVLDLGAHIGFYSIFMASLVGPKGMVYSFEPSPSNFAILKKNVWEGKYQNIIIEQKGVADRTKNTVFYLYDSLTNSLGAGLYNNKVGVQTIEVQTVAMDDYFRDYDGKIDFIKMDIEGAEKLALDGMLNLISKNPQLKIITEFAPFALLKASHINPEEYLSRLEQLGFHLFELEGYTANLQPVNVKEITLKLTPKSGLCVATNILCTR